MGNCGGGQKIICDKKGISNLSNIQNKKTVCQLNNEENTQLITSSNILNLIHKKYFDTAFKLISDLSQNLDLSAKYKLNLRSELFSEDIEIFISSFNNSFKKIMKVSDSRFDQEKMILVSRQKNLFDLESIFKLERSNLFMRMALFENILESKLVYSEDIDTKFALSVYHVKISDKYSHKRFKWVQIIKLISIQANFILSLNFELEMCLWTNEMKIKNLIKEFQNEIYEINIRSKFKKIKSKSHAFSKMSFLDFSKDIFSFDLIFREGDWFNGTSIFLSKNEVNLFIIKGSKE